MNTEAPNEWQGFNHLLRRLPTSVRGHLVAVIGEFIGTLSFIFFAFAGTQTANVASNVNTGETIITTTVQKNPAQLLYISLSFGFSLAVNAWVFFRISGGLFNPAVTIGMVLIGAITVFRGVLLFVTQIAGAIVGAFLVQALFTGDLNVSTTLSATTTVAQGVLIEMLLTALLVFTIFMLAAEKHTGNFIAPVGIGLALFIAEMVGVFWTGGSLNPARSLAPAVAIRSFRSTQWVYWVGPIAGAILAVGIFKIIKALEYETANPDPESVSPTGPSPGALQPAESRRERNEDLESGYYDSGKEDGSASRINSRNTYTNGTAYTNGSARLDNSPPMPNMANVSAQNHNAGRPYQQDIPMQNMQARNVDMVPAQSRAGQAYPTQSFPANSEIVQNGPADDTRWNAVHTANARENTHRI